MRPIEPLVSVAWLAQHAREPDLRIVDVRWALGDPGAGRRAYEEGHIEGARFLDLEQALAAPRGSGPGRHPLPTPETFARAMEAAGVGETTRVVAYDDAGGAHAARLWFLLRYFSHETGAVLDGGISAWRAAGHPVTREVPTVQRPATPLVAKPRPELIVSRAEVDRARQAGEALLLDARAPERYEGRSEPIDPRAGHIPGAKNAPFSGNLDGGRFLPPAELRRLYESLGAAPSRDIICYCGSGVTACHTLLALEQAGLKGARLYEGSWSDWSGDPSLPAATGGR